MNKEELLLKFMEENPLYFSRERMELVRMDFYGPRNGTVSDEYADFILWASGEKPRHEKFGEFLIPFIRKNNFYSILEVGCGENALLSSWLAAELGKEIRVTAMDMCGISCRQPNVRVIRREFLENEELSGYDAVVAQEPCDASERILKACTGQHIPYFVILCGVPHRRLDGGLDGSAGEWYGYLLSEYPGIRFMKWHHGFFSNGAVYSENGFGRVI